jgi:hypothetical protein
MCDHCAILQWYTICSMPNPKKERNNCRACGKETARSGYKYCSNACQHEYQYQEYIQGWKRGERLGFIKMGVVSRHLKRYLREKYGNKCCVCGWCSINVVTGLVPLVADHIDGNWRNNKEENLRLVCPNCDSLSPTYAALNKGRGRNHRVISRRAHEARLLAK